jgi:hypothetical protein
MPLMITSLLVNGPLMIPLTGGASVRLEPGATSDPLPEADVLNNAKIEKLVAQGVIEVRGPAKPQARGRSGAGSAAVTGAPRATSRKPAGSAKTAPSGKAGR